MHRLQSDESDWHPSPWLLSQLFLRWTLWNCVNLYKPANLFYLERTTRSCVDEPKCNSQFQAIVTQMKCLFFFLHIMQNKFCTRHVPTSCMSPDNICNSAWISIIWGWSSSSTTNIRTSLFTSIQVRPSCFFTPFSFPCHSTFSQRCLVANSSRHVWQQHITRSIVRLHFKNLFGNTFCHFHITINSTSAKQSCPCIHMWFTGHCHDHVLCLL